MVDKITSIVGTREFYDEYTGELVDSRSLTPDDIELLMNCEELITRIENEFDFYRYEFE